MDFTTIKLILSTIQYTKKIRVSDIGLKLGEGVIWSEEQLQMKEEILKGNYIESHPIISRDNICLNGYHRLLSLKEADPNRIIEVKKTFFKWETIKKLLEKKGLI
jgi:hypothetical protein